MIVKSDWLLLIVVAIVTVPWLCSTAEADVLLVKGDSQPKYGRVIESKNGVVLFRVAGSKESAEEMRLPESEVQAVHVNYDESRLMSLAPTNPRMYRDFAEELASQKVDPIARELGIRLYLIAAYLGDESGDNELVSSSLAGLVALARTTQEQRMFEILLKLRSKSSHAQEPVTTPPNDDVSSLPVSGGDSSNADSVSLRKVQSLVVMLRQEKYVEAREWLSNSKNTPSLALIDSIMNRAEIENCLSGSRLSSLQLEKLIRCEILLAGGGREAERGGGQVSDWFTQSQQAAKAWTDIPKIETVTEFDPKLSVYRAGAFVQP